MNTTTNWSPSRKQFIKSLLIGGAALQLPWLSSCSSTTYYQGDTSPFSKEEFKTFQTLLETLFPSDGNGPGAFEINADKYVLWVLNDRYVDPEINEYMLDRFDTFLRKCEEQTGSRFEDLTTSERDKLVAGMSEYVWGRKLFSRMLTLVFEALLLDPIYDVNPNGKGWKWLQHDPGMPRPTQQIRYPQILELSHDV